MKLRAGIAATCVVAIAGLSIAAGAAPRRDDSGLPVDEVKRGLKIAPVPLNLKGKNKALVGKGSYIVNAQGGCNDCHTNPSYAPGGNPFAGEPEQINADHYLAGGQQFGPFVSRNLTPDEQGRPAGMTFKEFKQVLRTGKDLSGTTLQVMPWPVYGKMTDKDLRAVYEYLRAIPPAQPGTTPPPAE
ncbi:MAG: cytochrome C [Armatimonadota bacterium]